MEGHDWYYYGLLRESICNNCGIFKVKANEDANCPPWSSTGEGYTETNRGHEAGEVNAIKFILNLVDQAEEFLYKDYSKACGIELIRIRNALMELIQKREGLNKK